MDKIVSITLAINKKIVICNITKLSLFKSKSTSQFQPWNWKLKSLFFPHKAVYNIFASMILFVKIFLTQLACGFIYCAYFKSQSSSLVWCPTRFLPTVTWHQSCINKYIPYIQRKKHRYCISFFANETRKWLDSFNFLLCSF